jgi:hypothetical protein
VRVRLVPATACTACGCWQFAHMPQQQWQRALAATEHVACFPFGIKDLIHIYQIVHSTLLYEHVHHTWSEVYAIRMLVRLAVTIDFIHLLPSFSRA